ncbi:hypothetical protein A946_03480 [Methylacidiphilum kamchatkense Kam1]|uniref:Uncharacterized protein n=1 Tax=Methylacidiphilum kamchatkense Kam1 TaxID=1202785 RepID=A0ABR4ZXX3_9BACT|nr:hypothetical protein A946_03480 [Methylacidiphilum kamchatkense Kam1]
MKRIVKKQCSKTHRQENVATEKEKRETKQGGIYRRKEERNLKNSNLKLVFYKASFSNKS